MCLVYVGYAAPFEHKNKIKSETRMTASVVNQDSKTDRVFVLINKRSFEPFMCLDFTI